MSKEYSRQFASFGTLRHAAEEEGVGLHSGVRVRVRLLPRDKPGIVFARVDLPGAPCVAASFRCVSGTTHATTLQQHQAVVVTTEHLLAALWMMGVTHCRVELDGPEVPILDGSAAGWCRAIKAAGVVAPAPVSALPVSALPVSALPATGPRTNAVPGLPEVSGVSGQPALYTLREPVWVSDGNSSMLGLPHDALRVTVAVEYARSYVGAQTFDSVLTPHSFETEIAPARTFTLQEWIEPLRAQGLIRGGSTENALVLGAEAPSAPWRFADEVARHKALDVLGDVALLFGDNGGALHAHLIAVRAGHGLHKSWMAECLRRQALLVDVA